MPSVMRFGGLGGLVALVLAATTAHAVDRPITGRKLVLRRTSSGQEKLAFVTTDPQFLFPTAGGPDDPAAGTPGGLTIELFSQQHAAARFDVPAGAGWATRTIPPAFYKYANKVAPAGPTPVGAIVLKSGRVFRVRVYATGLSVANALGSVAVRITIGSLRTCALFDAATVQRDAGGVFVARDASATLADCSNAALAGPTCADGAFNGECGGTCPPGAECTTRDLATCECIDSAQPCGDTNPACNGECPAGLECGNTGGFLIPGCGCVPPGTTPCGASPSCGGSCPSGTQCYYNSISIPIGTFSWCECLGAPPVDPCGGCPPGFECAILPGPVPQPICYPTQQCNGPSGYPVCDGTCSTGTCQATNNFCVCVP
jgi:hypothetical protein